jgi:hypothetical protein
LDVVEETRALGRLVVRTGLLVVRETLGLPLGLLVGELEKGLWEGELENGL